MRGTISNIICAQHQRLHVFHQFAAVVEVLVWMKDPDRSPCKVGKMEEEEEEEEGMLM